MAVGLSKYLPKKKPPYQEVNIQQGLSKLYEAAKAAGVAPGQPVSAAQYAQMIGHMGSAQSPESLQAQYNAARQKQALYNAKQAYDMAAAKVAFDQAKTQLAMDKMRQRAEERVQKMLSMGSRRQQEFLGRLETRAQTNKSARSSIYAEALRRGQAGERIKGDLPGQRDEVSGFLKEVYKNRSPEEFWNQYGDVAEQFSSEDAKVARLMADDQNWLNFRRGDRSAYNRAIAGAAGDIWDVEGRRRQWLAQYAVDKMAEGYVDAKNRLISKKPGGILGLGMKLIDIVDVPIESTTMRPFYAMMLASREGEGTGGILHAGLSAAARSPARYILGPGGASVLDEWGKKSDYANRVRGREAREREGLPSFGEWGGQKLRDNTWLMGPIGGSIYEKIWDDGVEIVFPMPGSTSGRLGSFTLGRGHITAAADGGFQFFGDPFTWASFGASAAAKVGLQAGSAGIRSAARQAAREAGEGALRASLRGSTTRFASKYLDDAVRTAAGRTGRRAWLTGTRRGRALSSTARRAVTSSEDALDLSRRLRDLPLTEAEKVIAAKRAATGGVDEAMKVVERAFVSGHWNPLVTLRRQALGGLTARTIGQRSLPGLLGRSTVAGRGVVRRSLDTAARRNIHTPLIGTAAKGIRAVSDGVANRAIARSSFNSVEEYWTAIIKPRADKLDDGYGVTRFEHLMAAADSLADEVPGLGRMVDQELRQLSGNITDPMVKKGIEERLRTLEVIVSMVMGDAGKTARDQAVFLIDYHAADAVNLTTKSLMKDAQAGLGMKGGLKFPAEPKLKGKVGRPAKERTLETIHGELRKAYERLNKLTSRRTGLAVKATLRGAKAHAALEKALRRLRSFADAEKELAELLGKNAEHTPGAFIDDLAIHEAEELRAAVHNALDEIADAELVGASARKLTPQEESLRQQIDLLRDEVDNFYKKWVDDSTVQFREWLDWRIKLAEWREIGPVKVPNEPEAVEALRSRMVLLPDEVRGVFRNELDMLVEKGVKNLNKLARRTEAVILNKDLRDEMVRLAKQTRKLKERQPELTALVHRPGLGPRSLVRGPGELLLSANESRSPGILRFHSHENPAVSLRNRLQDGDRWLQALGFDRHTRREFAKVLAGVQTEKELADLVTEVVGVWTHMVGGDPIRVMDSYRGQLADARKVAFGPGDVQVVEELAGTWGRIPRVQTGDGELDQAVQMLTQLRNSVPLADPDELRKTVRHHIMAHGQGKDRVFAAARVGLGKPLNIPLAPRSVMYNGKNITVGSFLRGAHAFWKYAVVTNFTGVIGGAAGGAIGGEDIWDRVKMAGLGFALGTIGGMRYIGRVVGVEERFIRYHLHRGLNPLEWIPGMSKYHARSGVDLPARNLADAVAPSMYPTQHIKDSFWLAQSDDFIPLLPQNSRYVQGWADVINYQIHPETDVISQLVLEGLTGRSPNWRKVAKEWLETTEAGKLHMERIRHGKGNAGIKANEVIDRAENFIRYYLPTEELQTKRLLNAADNALIDLAELKPLVKAGVDRPPVVHARETWKIPKNWHQFIGSMKQLYPRFVLEKPTANISRIPMANHIYRDEYLRLTRGGVPAKEARDIAEELAVNQTNRVMFVLNDESRFAAKADFLFPFQQPREEMIRVYAQLFANNKARAFRATRLGALAFNEGAENGVFYEDNNGDWRMRVPGSAYLSKLFGQDLDMMGDAPVFDFKLRDTMFFLQGAQAAFRGGGFLPDTIDRNGLASLFEGVVPVPGGPLWTYATWAAFKVNPDLEKALDNNEWLKERLFPFGVRHTLFRAETNRLWMAMTGSTPPWELAGKDEQQAALDRIHQDIFNQLTYSNGGEPPSLEEVKKQTSSFLLTWAAVGSVVPAPTRPTWSGRKEYDRVKVFYEKAYGDQWFAEFAKDRPDLMVYTQSKTKLVDDSYEGWLADKEFDINRLSRGERRYLSLEEYSNEFRQARKQSAAWKEFWDVENAFYLLPEDRYEALDRFAAKNPEWDKIIKSDYYAEKELTHILYKSSGPRQAELLDNWRKRYDIGYHKYERMRSDIIRYRFRVDEWKEARHVDDLKLALDEAAKRGIAEDVYMKWHMSAAEQIKVWQERLNNQFYLDAPRSAYGTGVDASSPWETHKRIRELIGKIQRENPQLYNRSGAGKKPEVQKVTIKGTPEYRGERIIRKMTGGEQGNLQNFYSKVLRQTGMAEIQMLNDRIYNELNPAIEAAKAAKDWSTSKLLKAERTRLYDLIRDMKSEFYQARYPDLDQLKKDMQSMMYFALNPDSPQAMARLREWQKAYDEHGIPTYTIDSEERHYKAANPEVKRAYIDYLTNKLDQEPFTKGKLLWSYLTDFQKDLLEKMVPDWKTQHWLAESEKGASGGKGWKSRAGNKRYYRRRYYGGGDGELSYAYALFKKYNRRTGSAPAAYQTYLNLPRDPAIRRAFLQEHPDVAEWIRLGPLAQMSEIERYIVTDIMIRHGKWEGEPRDMDELNELAFARLQLRKWSRRGEGMTRPSSYDQWMAMPTGPEKVAYLEAHPELQDWIRNGPMANMPEEYRSVVRDIMMRYGEWTEAQDPLGKLISEFYRLPGYARKKFLEDHPEIEAYWRVLRSPEEQRLGDLADTYFSIQDPTARRAFAAAHPELQEWFLHSRTRRYEKFLNQVAAYMGANPELFDRYLNRQTEVLAELVRKFGTIPMVRERTAAIREPAQRQVRQASSGRIRTG
jgi:hypothetical protein